MDKHVLERKVFHAGQKILLANTTHTNAYLIQKGEVRAYVHDEFKEVEVARYGDGHLIGETNLIIDSPTPLTFEAVTDTTVVVIVRQDFEKKLSHIDPTMLNIIITLIQKLKKYEHESMDHALEKNKVHVKAYEIVEHLLRDMRHDRKDRYRQVMQPHFNILCHALEDLKERELQEKNAILSPSNDEKPAQSEAIN